MDARPEQEEQGEQICSFSNLFISKSVQRANLFILLALLAMFW